MARGPRKPTGLFEEAPSLELRPSPLFFFFFFFFFRLASNEFPDIGSVSRIEKKKKKKKKTKKKKRRRTLGNRRPGTSASLLWSLETTRHEPKINMAEKVFGVIVKLKQHGKKNQAPKFLCDIKMV